MRRLQKIGLIFFLLILLSATGAVGFLTVTMAGLGDLPDIRTPLTSTFYDRNNEVITTRFEQNRFEVKLEEVPADLINAFIAVEDHRFYRHRGIDFQGLLRAAARNLIEGRIVEGGSTITQQLARNLFLTHERTLTRKIQEMLITVQLERRYTKDEILEKYLNTIYFGHGAYGVEAAAQTYFSKPVTDLALAESALLAGIPRGPARYSPVTRPVAAQSRRNLVLTRMAEEGFISQAEKTEAAISPLNILERQDRSVIRAKRRLGVYFIDHLIRVELARLFPDNPQIAYRGGLHIHTTLDKRMQQAAEKVVADENILPSTVRNDEGMEVRLEAALLAMDPGDGSVLAMVGGRDYRESQINMAVRRRSPGSAFKPFTFAAALEAGYTAATVRDSAPIVFEEAGLEPYYPTEYNEQFYGPLRLRDALARSSNIVSIILHNEIGRGKTVDMAKRLGIQSDLEANLSLPLGTSEVTLLEMAAAYSPFANQGIAVTPRFITKITDSDGRVLYRSEPEKTAVLDARIAYLMTDMMKSVMRPGGTGAAITLSRPNAGKTGTSERHRNNYMVGYTPDLITAVWVGNLEHQSLGFGMTGARLSGQVWSEFMRLALAGTPPQDFKRPGGLVSADICPHTGLLHNPVCRLEPLRELFLAGTAPDRQCGWPACPYCPPEPQWHWNGGRFRSGNTPRDEQAAAPQRETGEAEEEESSVPAPAAPIGQ